MPSTTNIDGTEKVIAALGYWPTFHDAEVISFSAERVIPTQVGETLARLVVHVRKYEVVGEGTKDFAQVLRKSVLVQFLFAGASDLEITDFNHQNVITSITVSLVPSDHGKLLVDIESIWGLGGTLRCAAACIESVQELSCAEA